MQRWSCSVVPRPSLVKLQVVQAPPVLVGEWYPLSLLLTNTEEERTDHLEVAASLRDASDPLVADTTLLSLAPGLPLEPTSPSDSPPVGVVAPCEDLAAGDQCSVTIYLRASTVGPRAVVLRLSYSVAGVPALLVQTLELPVEDPFTLASCFLSQVCLASCNHGCHFGPNSDHWSNSGHLSKMVRFFCSDFEFWSKFCINDPQA